MRKFYKTIREKENLGNEWVKEKRITRSQELIRRLRQNKSAIVGITIIIFLVLCGIFADFIAPNDPLEQSLSDRLKPGFWSDEGVPGKPLGTDAHGRCILSRIIYGTRYTLSVGFVALFIATGIGIVFGVLSGYFGGGVDHIIMRFVDILFAFPALLLAIVIVAVLGTGLEKAMIAIGIVYSPQMARVVRGSVISVKEMDYIEAQHAIGSSSSRIIFHHVIPNSMAPIIVYGTLMLATAILDAAALGFLGLGAQPP
ncbi:MAG: ABC transporter permease, partial [Candidatus Methanofastidiosia archaeon]